MHDVITTRWVCLLPDQKGALTLPNFCTVIFVNKRSLSASCPKNVSPMRYEYCRRQALTLDKPIGKKNLV